ncbi:MAG: hypothetical protein ACT4N8_03455 [Sphingosinicella sp.]|uniref:hypothetical protein n=1 Tax=Sphingosinicella sp. TaxID=1917971 RepID=UPI004037692C
MFEAITGRVARIAEARAAARRRELAEEARSALPAGVRIEENERGLVLVGRRLARRFALDPALRWLFAGLAK